ncbi:MAG: lysophospholipid acyltransferase family protein [Peptostreptococcus porci]|uniref:lysophospholipid acyltransferase family protein n=1 Tax=Peptostreptococcus porci TaxID=2652282 RepID=UPI002A837BFB|nr:lysophospholipid acyltransferase family protein [Peptostreptococcus porci]MDY4129259.1 lysophospholipid acyltransferase family protein [Peptostreptococcus porci]MDY5480414.1 lysophospholipid acyltransferase family protein [Peptostreptococcus porci]MDY6232201.1 lysophospholipid acyltransferase family protein [Peptostreptococcus porci]
MSFYKFVVGVLSFLSKILYRVEIIGEGNIPSEGNLIIIANHKHFLDPVFMLVAVKNRKIIPVAKQELFSVPILKFFMKKVGAIPVNRDNPSISTFRAVLSEIKSGNVLGIFPEGTRADTYDFLTPKSGTTMFSIKTKSDIVPMSIISTFKLFSKVKVVIGEPIDMSQYYNRKVDKSEYQGIVQECFDVVVKNYKDNMGGIIPERTE